MLAERHEGLCPGSSHWVTGYKYTCATKQRMNLPSLRWRAVFRACTLFAYSAAILTGFFSL
jgi:hypothetical protein